MYYIQINNDVNGNPRYLLPLTEEEAKRIGARKAGKSQITLVDTLQDDYIYFNYIVSSYNIIETINDIKNWKA